MKNFRFILLILVFFACKDEEIAKLPTVETASVDGISDTSARIGGRVVDNGGSEVTEFGVYWGTSSNPDTSGTKLALGLGTAVFYDTLQNLTSGVKYFVKAYATNKNGTAYGNETFFTTQINLPTLATSVVSDITPTSAIIGGNITDDGGFEISSRGVYWGIKSDLLNSGTKLELGTGKGIFSTSLIDLEKGITYYYQAFAVNIKGTVYGEMLSFTTNPELPVVSTTDVVNIGTHSAMLGGEIKSNGGSSIIERGIYWGKSTEPQTSGTKFIIGSTGSSFIDSIKILLPQTTYYFVAYAINSKGTSYGTEKSFKTLGGLPKIGNRFTDSITTSNVKLSGIIDSINYLNTTVTFEYGTTSSYGTSVSSAKGIITKDHDTAYIKLGGLTPNTTYHFRVKAENELGAVYSNDSTFMTVLDGITGSVTDTDGNSYGTIGIGHQTWMTENLKTTKYNDGSAITLVEKDSIWQQLSTGGYCWFENNISYKNTYGAMYNWYTVNTGKLCPNGWHVPSETEFTTLVNYLGGASKAGGLLKATGTSFWNDPNTGATNQYGFNARAAGLRDNQALFDFININGNWWSSTNYSTQTAAYLYMIYNYENSFQNYINKKYGFSVRCIKN
jgi:uncharacterized protein (TIGR02145 family)